MSEHATQVWQCYEEHSGKPFTVTAKPLGCGHVWFEVDVLPSALRRPGASFFLANHEDVRPWYTVAATSASTDRAFKTRRAVIENLTPDLVVFRSLPSDE